MSHRVRLVISSLVMAALVASAVVGLLDPRGLIGAASWSLAAVAALHGLGIWVERLSGAELQRDERIVLGTCAWLALTGWLLAVGRASHAPLCVVAALGFATTLVDLALLATRTQPSAQPLGISDRVVRVALWFALAAFLSLNLLGMIGTRGNPADDQVAYTALVKRVLDCGDLVEPFSFRRLSAYGGQTMLLALAALRGDVASIDLLDRGIFQWIAIAVVLGMARRRRLSLALTVPLIVFVLSLWDLELNSGAIWTGFTCFLAGYGFACRGDLPTRTRLCLTFLVLGAACTLRQNYLVPAGVFGLLLLISYLREAARVAGWRGLWRSERRVAGIALAAVAVIVAPYMIAAVASSGTALYPVMRGTGNPALPLRPTGGTWFDEIAFFVRVGLTPQPIRVWWLILPVMLIARDRRPLRPWSALLGAGLIGFAALVHSFMLSDEGNLWRYAFGYSVPIAVAFAIELAAGAGSELDGGPQLRVPGVASWLIGIGLVINVLDSRVATAKRFTTTLEGISAGWRFGSRKPEPRLAVYPALQRAVPEGAPLAVLLDDPWMLDYARNPIANLDFPGAAGPAPGLPCFTTPEHWRSYLVAHGLRYVAFVDPSASAYLYRRSYWRRRMFTDDELYQFLAARIVDALEALQALEGSSRVVFRSSGMTVIDLGAAVVPEPPRGPPEDERMDHFLAAASDSELGRNAWQLTRRRNVVFRTDGMGPTTLLPDRESDDPAFTDLWRRLGGRDEIPHRWLMDRTHIRVLGTGRERLHAKLWVRLANLRSQPVAAFSVDGETLAELTPDRDGYITLDAPAACTGWCDLYIIFNTTFDWWLNARENGIAQLLELDWSAP